MPGAREPEPPGRFPWERLPPELRVKILSSVPLPELLLRTQDAFPGDAPSVLDTRIRALQPLWRAWLDSPIEVRNVVAYRTRAARAACPPVQFVSLERLVLGTSALSGVLSPAVAEFAASLKVLHLDDNFLTGLPPELARCKNLVLLDCSENHFDAIPDVVMAMHRLKFISFACNRNLRAVSRDVAALPDLMTLSLFECSLTSLPFELIQKVSDTDGFALNVGSNNFEKHYLIDIAASFPTFRQRLTHVMFE